jgi:hypothetical protein
LNEVLNVLERVIIELLTVFFVGVDKSLQTVEVSWEHGLASSKTLWGEIFEDVVNSHSLGDFKAEIKLSLV